VRGMQEKTKPTAGAGSSLEVAWKSRWQLNEDTRHRVKASVRRVPPCATVCNRK
jgi:hypothetical protein